MLFLLTDDQGRALLIAESATQAQADSYGNKHVPGFCGASVPVESDLQIDAEEFWGIRTVNIAAQASEPVPPASATAVAERPKRTRKPAMGITTHVWVRGLELPDEVVEDDLLTPEDRRDLALDHIARTCTTVGYIEILKWA